MNLHFIQHSRKSKFADRLLATQEACSPWIFVIRSSRHYILQQAFVRQQYLSDKCLFLYVQSWSPVDGRKNGPKRVECHYKINKFDTLVHLVGFTIGIGLITVSSTCFEHPSVHPQEDLYIQFYSRWQDVHILPSTKLLIWMHERNVIKLHVQDFPRMNTWIFGKCRRHYN